MKKKGNTKFLSAVFLSLLALTGGVLAMPLLGTDNQLTQIQESVKLFEKNPERFLQTENLGLRSGFENPNSQSTDSDYSDLSNYATNEGALDVALEERDYDAWKEALQNIEGFSETDVISKEDFNILVALHNSKDSGETELENI
jgi:hypothetical protein